MRRILARPILALALAAAPFLGACSNSSAGKSEPPPGRVDHQPPADDTGAGFASPPPTDEEPPPAPPPVEVSPELAARIKQTFGDECRHERSCGGMMGIDCKAAVDGPYYYVRSSTLEVVSVCGGACMRGCTNCPPRDWTCATY